MWGHRWMGGKGRTGQEDRWQKAREKNNSCTQLHSFSSVGLEKKNQSHLSFRFRNVQVGRKKKEVCGAADDRGRTVRITWIPEQHCRQDTEVTSHLCLFYFPLFQGESHYSSLVSRGRLTINRDKHWWPLTYPWQWPSAEQNQTLAFVVKPLLGVTWSLVQGPNGIWWRRRWRTVVIRSRDPSQETGTRVCVNRGVSKRL